MPPPINQTAEDRFRAAFARLKAGEPQILPRGNSVSQNNVAKEAECDPSALRKSRYPELINEIQAYVDAHQGDLPPSRRQEILKKRNKNRTVRQAKLASDQQRDQLASQLLSANAMIIELTRKLADAQARPENSRSSADRFLFPTQSKTSPKATPYDASKE